ncbi:VPLPA-CTERM sorting domain-containing protein [uncultured Roseobacter sp.]|uniref:VPLPA-CTERM sorting domain-containing protein n=1 Tax=uncultured Roseobacter sp. TaxID=114847 RepID=UPI00261D20FF|nr:VPLPA-CTERM sorting domain-containing protein [uncultured Roseobacter sp.]
MKYIAMIAIAASFVVSEARAAPITIFWSGTVAGGPSRQGGSLDFGIGNFDRISGTLIYEDGFDDLDPLPESIFARGVESSVTVDLNGTIAGWSSIDSDQGTTGSTFDISNNGALFASELTIAVADNDLSDALKADDLAPAPVAITIGGVERDFTSATAKFEIGGVSTGLFGRPIRFDTLDPGQFRKLFVAISLGERMDGASGTGANEFVASVGVDYWSSSGPRPLDPAPVTPVPLPAAGWMLLCSLAALGGVASKRKEPA